MESFAPEPLKKILPRQSVNSQNKSNNTDDFSNSLII